MVPVKDLSWRGLRSHFRHGLPVRSRARSPALMAPVLALGPSLWDATGLGPATVTFFPSIVRSMLPSALEGDVS